MRTITVGDLSAIAVGENVKDAMRPLLEQHYPNDAKTFSRKAGKIRDFIVKMQDGDVIVAADGERVLAVGRVSGSYRYENTEPTGAPHRRPVEWVSTEEWKMPNPEGLRTTFFSIGRHANNVVAIERKLLDGNKALAPKIAQAAPNRSLRLDGIPGRI